MFRYNLRTLLIFLAVAPPVLAGLWIAAVFVYQHPVLTLVVVVPFLCAASVAVNAKRMARELFDSRPPESDRAPTQIPLSLALAPLLALLVIIGLLAWRLG
jgi:hypothetical protein